ncbi:MAG TPA: tetratricopeptide repeat protein, partial [Polyangia bacterium]|nr:tetratricopeptide repeat protein [Polyangia bacterium]
MDLEQEGKKRDFRVRSFVGREQERRALDAALGRATRFDAPQFVTVIGENGLGKTRLVQEWVKRVEEAGEFRVFLASGKPPAEGPAAPFAMLAALLRKRFGIAADMDDTTAQAAFRAELQIVFGDRRVSEVAGLLGRFLGFDMPESPLAQSLAMRPERQLDMARAVLGRFLEEDARKHPLALVVDDAHLADDASLDVLQCLSAELGEAAIVVVATARPELFVRRPQWMKQEGSHARIDVKPLAPLEMDVFIKCALGAQELAPGLAERAAIESGGNPFLLEQLLGVYHEHGILVAATASSWLFDMERADQEPVALAPEAAAQARVATLSSAERELLGRAVAMGPVFWAGGVVALGRIGADPWDPTIVFAPDPSIEETRRLAVSLQERGFIERAPEKILNGGDTAWALVEPAVRAIVEATVDPRTLAERRCFAAQWIEARLGTSPSSEQREYVAALYAEGGDDRRAAPAYLAAGDLAGRRRRYERARALYLHGVRLLAADDALLKIDACHKLGDAAARLGRGREALAHFGEMLRVAWRLDLPAKGGAAHSRIGRIHRSLGDYRLALQHLDMAHLLFDLADDRPGVAASLDDIGRVNYLIGRPDEAIRCHKAALSIREELNDQRGKTLTLSWMGLVQAQIGELGRAQQSFQEALLISKTTRDPHGIVFSLLDLGSLAREAGHPGLAHNLLEQARGVAREMGECLNECHLALQIGECHLALGQVDEAEAELRAARDIARKFGARRLCAEADRGLAEICLFREDHVGAREHASRAAAEGEKLGAGPLVGAALRVLA